MNIFLTAKGRALKKRARKVPETLLCQSGLTPEAFMGLRNDLKSLLAHIRAFDPDGDTCTGAASAPSTRKRP